MLEVLKLVSLFFLVFLVMRILGKSLLSQWTSYDFVTIFFLSYSGLSTIQLDGFPYAVISILTIGIIYIIIGKLSLMQHIRPLIVGEPLILIRNGKIIKGNLKKSRFSLTELLSSIRETGFPDIKEIDYAILEPNGGVSVIPEKDSSPLTPKDVNLHRERKGLTIAVIVEGKIQVENLALISKSEKWLMKELAIKGYQEVDKIFYAYVNDQSHSLMVDTFI